MEEQQYKDTYQAINERRCVFEKTINSRRSACSKSVRFHLADREGISCKSASGNALCTELLMRMRSNARFALHMTHAEGQLPHAKEIRVQTGGLLGLQDLIHPELEDQQNVADIITTLDLALQRYDSLEQLPYDIIVQGIVKFEGRRKRTPKSDE
ncbi:MAG: hypothetical protein OEU91_04355 [Gammaproteobacteria bacterium]|nr:hypothetical protein [Gammaproteobacteria bacterium]